MPRTEIDGGQVQDESLTGDDILNQSIKPVDIDLVALVSTLRSKDVVTVSTSPYTIQDTDYIIRVDATSGPITINLPSASALTGREFKIVKIDSSVNAVIISPSGSDTVMTDTTKEICYQNTLMIINSDGVGNWI